MSNTDYLYPENTNSLLVYLANTINTKTVNERHSANILGKLYDLFNRLDQSL